MSAVTQTSTVARVGTSTPAGKTQWVERRASRLAAAFSLTQQAALAEAERDYWAFRGVGGLCDQCDNTFFCSRPGCVRLAPAVALVPLSPVTLSKPAPSAAQANRTATLWAWKLLIWAVAALVIAAGVLL